MSKRQAHGMAWYGLDDDDVITYGCEIQEKKTKLEIKITHDRRTLMRIIEIH